MGLIVLVVRQRSLWHLHLSPIDWKEIGMKAANTGILIVGGGVIGNSIAYHLARQGREVLVIDRSSIAETPSASWASAGGVRRQGRHPAEAKLASEAIGRWETLEQEIEADVGYRRGGNLLLAESDEEVNFLATFVEHQHEMGFADVHFVDRKEALSLVPGINERVVAGSFSPHDGQADPVLTTRAFAKAAQRFGARYWIGVYTSSLLMHNNHIAGAQTEHGEVKAAHVVLAAGAWSDELAATIGVQLPIRTRALQMLLSTPSHDYRLGPVISAVSRTLSLKQVAEGGFLLGGGWLGYPSHDRRSYTMRSSSIRGNWATAVELLPVVGEQRVARSWCGLEAHSIDDIPFIGRIPGLSGLTVAVGFSGHGFALSPTVGRCIADQINGLPTPELDALNPSRVATFSPEAIDAFLSEPTRGDFPT
jgi:glycine/D-amino acid oxidase-like deaminating enzyme